MSARPASTDPSSGAETPPAGALQRLLDVERQAEEALVRARADARTLLEAARRRARTMEETADRDLAGDAERLELDVRAWRDERRAAVEAEAEAGTRRYEAVGPERVEELGSLVVDELLGGSRFEGP